MVDTFADAVYDYAPSGARTTITSGNFFALPEGIARLGKDDYLVADRGANDGVADGSVIRIKNGVQSVLASGFPLVDPHAIALSADRKTTYVGSRDGSIVAVSIPGGAKQQIVSGATLVDVRALAVERTGTLLVTETGPDRVLRVDPSNGNQTTVASGAPLSDPRSLVIRTNGDLLVGDQVAGLGAAIFRIDPPNPTATVFNDGPDFDGASVPGGLAFDLAGNLIVSDRNNPAASGCSGGGGCGRILRLSSNGATVADIVSAASAELSEPSGILFVPPKCGGRDATAYGTPGAETLTGTRFADVIVGAGGGDTIKGLAGKDVLCGGTGRDKLIGGKGGDTLVGGAGRDRLIGGKGRDKLRGGPGRDVQRQ